jgi:crotonobetainyl-CoA:carnitine CoA-transferase CaiB-like acyl-CoA transferase
MAVTGEPDGPPTKVGVAVLDLLAGLECAVGALAALVGRGTGPGASVNVSLVEAGVASLINVLGGHLASGIEPRRHGTAHPNIVPYQAFETADGPVVIACGNDRQFLRLLAVLGLEEADGRYATNPQRVALRDDLVAWLVPAIRRRERAELLAALAAADVPSGPVNSVAEALDAMGGDWLEEVDGIRMAPSPIRLGGASPAIRRPPLLGEHTDEVLSELG